MESEEKTVAVDVNEAFIVKSDAGDLCRLCANTDNQLIPIFRGEGLEHNIPNKIEKHLPIIKVTEIDKLPLQICYQCASTLIAWHNLYEGCRVADKRLREILCIDDKLYQDDEPFGDYVDDYRDDYDDQSRTNYEAIPLSSTPSTSDLPANNLLKNTSTEITQLDEAKTFNETELDSTDERCRIATKTSPKSSQTKPDSLFFKCGLCCKVFLKKHNLRRHALLHTAKKKPRKAPVASASDDQAPQEREDETADLLKLCEQVVINGQKFSKCIKCGFIGKGGSSKLTCHLRRHRLEYAYCCEICGKQFRNNNGLQQHTQRQHENNRRYECETCRRKFFTRLHLEQHERIHTGERPYVCDVCGKTFVQKSSLFVHTKFHEGEKSHICSFCGRGFITTSGLLVHVRRHKGERNHVCVHCGKAFVSTSQLKSHTSMHFDDRPFECTICGAKFKLRKHLKVHSNSHANAKVD